MLALLYLRNKAENNEKFPKARSIYHSFRGIIHHVCPFLPLLPVFVVRSKVLTAVPCIPLAIYYVKRHGKAFSISFFVIMLLIHIFCTICGNYNKNNQLVLEPHTLATKLVLVVSPDFFSLFLLGIETNRLWRTFVFTICERIECCKWSNVRKWKNLFISPVLVMQLCFCTKNGNAQDSARFQFINRILLHYKCHSKREKVRKFIWMI